MKWDVHVSRKKKREWSGSTKQIKRQTRRRAVPRRKRTMSRQRITASTLSTKRLARIFIAQPLYILPKKRLEILFAILIILLNVLQIILIHRLIIILVLLGLAIP